MIDELVAFLSARLDEDEAAAKAGSRRVGMPWRAEPQAGTPGGLVLDEIGLVGSTGGRYAAEHMARYDPDRALREIEAGRQRITALMRFPHDYNSSDEWYSCSQAVEPHPAPGDEGPGSGCSNDQRRGKPCDCGRDALVRRMLRIDAAVYAGHPDYRPEWKTQL